PAPRRGGRSPGCAQKNYRPTQARHHREDQTQSRRRRTRRDAGVTGDSAIDSARTGQPMKAVKFIIGLILLVAVAGGAFVLLRHPDWIKRGAHEEDEKEPPTDVPVKVAHVEKATL